MITETKINDATVEVVKTLDPFTRDNVKGYDYVTNPFACINIVSKRASGKSTLINTLVRQCIDKRTKVFIFSGSIAKDPIYKKLIDYLKDNGIAVKTYGSFIENGVNIVTNLLDVMNEDHETVAEKQESKVVFTDKTVRPKRKKKEKMVPDVLLVFDDQGAMLRHQSISTLVKVARNLKIMCMFSYHAATDMLPSTQQQSDVCILFGEYPEDKLEALFHKLAMPCTFEDFKKYYYYATRKKYDCLYVDVRANKFRKNFNIELHL